MKTPSIILLLMLLSTVVGLSETVKVGYFYSRNVKNEYGSHSATAANILLAHSKAKNTYKDSSTECNLNIGGIALMRNFNPSTTRTINNQFAAWKTKWDEGSMRVSHVNRSGSVSWSTRHEAQYYRDLKGLDVYGLISASNSGNIGGIANYASNRFVVERDYLNSYVLAHEIAHLFLCSHDKASTPCDEYKTVMHSIPGTAHLTRWDIFSHATNSHEGCDLGGSYQNNSERIYNQKFNLSQIR